MADTSLYIFFGIIISVGAYLYFYDPNYAADIPLVLIALFAGIALGGAFI